MKRSFEFRLAGLAVLAVLSALSFTGCQTGAAWRSDGPKGDTPWVREGVGGPASVVRDRPCRFG